MQNLHTASSAENQDTLVYGGSIADWKVFRCVPGGKTPLPGSNGLDDAKVQPRDNKTNWAVSCGASGLFVLDIDGPDGEDALAALEMQHGTLPPTYEVRTPRGGRHIYFTGQGKSSVQKLGPKLDTRGDGGYVLLPGSYKADGSYSVLHDRPIAAAPVWLIELAGRQRDKSVAAANVELDLPNNIDLAISDLKRLPRASVGGRNDACYRAACLVRERGCSEGATLELVDDHYNQHLDEPLEESELEITVWSAFKSAQNDVGARALRPTEETFAAALTSHLDSSPSPKKDVRTTTNRFRAMPPHLGALKPPIEFWDEGMTLPKIPGGSIGVAYGPYGSHKSGTLLWDMIALASSGVVVVNALGEGLHGVETARTPAMAKAHGIPLESLEGKLHNCPGVPDLSRDDDVAEFIAYCEEVKPDIIVLDTWSTALGSIDPNTGHAGAQLTGNGSVGRIKAATKATIIVVAHPGKDERKGISGNNSVPSNAEWVWRIAFTKSNGLVERFVEKMKDGRDKFSTFHRVVSTGGPPIYNNVSPVEADRVRAKDKEYLRETAEKASVDLIAHAIRINPHASTADLAKGLPGNSSDAAKKKKLERMVQRDDAARGPLYDFVVRDPITDRPAGAHWSWKVPDDYFTDFEDDDF